MLSHCLCSVLLAKPSMGTVLCPKPPGSPPMLGRSTCSTASAYMTGCTMSCQLLTTVSWTKIMSVSGNDAKSVCCTSTAFCAAVRCGSPPPSYSYSRSRDVRQYPQSGASVLLLQKHHGRSASESVSVGMRQSALAGGASRTKRPSASLWRKLLPDALSAFHAAHPAGHSEGGIIFFIHLEP